MGNGYATLAASSERPCPSCRVHLGLSGPAEGPIEDRLAVEVIAPEAREALVTTEPARVVASEPRPLASTVAEVNGFVVVSFAVEAGGGYQFGGYQFLAFEREASQNLAASLNHMRDVLPPFIDALRYVSEGAEPLMPPPEPGDREGFPWGWYQYESYGLVGMVDHAMLYRTLAFGPDGHFYEGAPPWRIEPLDPEALRASGDPNWGTYREVDGFIDLSYGGGEVERLQPFDVEGAWWDGGFTLCEVEALEDGATLDSTIGWADFEGFSSFGNIQCGMSSGASTTFRPDGTYEGRSYDYGNMLEADGDLSNATGDVTGGFASGGEAPGWSSTYEVQDGLVVMTPADGSEPWSQLALRVGDGVVIGDMDLGPS